MMGLCSALQAKMRLVSEWSNSEGGWDLSCPIVGTAAVRVDAASLHHPNDTRVLLSTAAQHRAPRWDAGTHPDGGGSVLHEREGLLVTARGETGWSGEKHPLKSCCGASSVVGMCSRWGPAQFKHHHHRGTAADRRLQAFNTDIGITSGC